MKCVCGQEMKEVLTDRELTIYHCSKCDKENRKKKFQYRYWVDSTGHRGLMYLFSETLSSGHNIHLEDILSIKDPNFPYYSEKEFEKAIKQVTDKEKIKIKANALFLLAIEQLPTKQRQVVKMRLSGKLQFNEISKIMGSNSWRYYYTGINNIKKFLKDVKF